MDKKARNFRNYKVWQEAVNHATEVYKITNGMSWFEKKGLWLKNVDIQCQFFALFSTVR